MKNFKVKGMKIISKSQQKSISGGINPHALCLVRCEGEYNPGPQLWKCWQKCGIYI